MQVHKRFWMQAHIIAFGMVGIGMSWAVRQAGSAARPLAAAVTLLLVALQVGQLAASRCARQGGAARLKQVALQL